MNIGIFSIESCKSIFDLITISPFEILNPDANALCCPKFLVKSIIFKLEYFFLVLLI